MITAGRIAEDSPHAPDVRALLERHLEFSRAQTPLRYSFALDAGGLVDPAITMFSFRDGGRLLGIAALRRLDSRHGEIKSMHTAEAARGRGVARALLAHLLGVARSRGFRRVSLETGTTAGYAPARALYLAAGFTPCGPFGGYRRSGHNFFMTLDLGLARPQAGSAQSPPSAETRQVTG